MKKFIVPSIFAVILLIGLNWILLIPLSLNFVSSTVVVSLIIIVTAVLYSIAHGEGDSTGYIVTGIVVVLFFGYAIVTSGIFRANDYKQLVGTIKEEVFSKDISPIDLTQIPVVDKDFAEKLAEKKLGEAGAIGSQVVIGEPVKQIVKNKLYWVVPLLHSGFFSWASNSEGTPGYIMVSAINADDVTFVKEINKKPIFVKYQSNGFFGDDLARRTYYNGNMTKGLTDYSFEINDEGLPYWVISRYENTIGFKGEKVIGTSVVDAQTGQVQNYDIEHTPSWVDRIQPEYIIRDQLDLYGKYISGFQWFTDNNKLQTTDGGEMVYDKGICYYYTGITSIGKDNATIGFTLTNTKTHQTTLYKVSGATELASVKSAEGKVQNMGYTGTFPILINIENIPTYFTTLKDKDGIVRMYGMISVKDYNIVGVGDTPKQALADYTKALAGKGNLSSIESSGKSNNVKGTILRIGLQVTDKTTYYHIITKEKPNLIFVIALDASNELPITQPGDSIQLSYVDSEGIVINATGFDNLQFAQKKSETQQVIEKQNQEVIDRKQVESEVNESKSMEQSISNLSDEDKKKVLEILNTKK